MITPGRVIYHIGRLVLCMAVLFAHGSLCAEETLRLVTVSNPRNGLAVIVDVPDGRVTAMRFPGKLPLSALVQHDHLALGPMLATHASIQGKMTGVRAELGSSIVSPDGRHRLDLRKDHWSLSHSSEAHATAIQFKAESPPMWSYDSTRFVWKSAEGIQLYVLEDKSTRLADTLAHPVSWSPDNTAILLMNGSQMELLHLKDGLRETFDLPVKEVHSPVIWSSDGSQLYLLVESNGIFRPNHSPEFYPPAYPALPLARLAVFEFHNKTFRYLTDSTKDCGMVEFIALPSPGKLAGWEFRMERYWDKGPGGIPVRRARSFGRLLLIDPADGAQETLLDLNQHPEALPEYRPGVLSILQSRSAWKQE